MILDKTLADYIKRAQEQLKKEDQTPSNDNYKVFPEQQGEEDRPLNPYGEH